MERLAQRDAHGDGCGNGRNLFTLPESVDCAKVGATMAQSRPLMILIAGPYRSGTGDDLAKMHANVEAMEEFALPIFRAGHIPIVGEWLALPLVKLAGSARVGDAVFNEIFHPIAERLVVRCDAVLRVGGASAGADEMVRLATARGLAVYYRLDDIPPAA